MPVARTHIQDQPNRHPRATRNRRRARSTRCHLEVASDLFNPMPRPSDPNARPSSLEDSAQRLLVEVSCSASKGPLSLFVASITTPRKLALNVALPAERDTRR